MKTKILIFFLNFVLIINLIAQNDNREYQHGIDLIKLNNDNYYLIWASCGNPPIDSWTHDIFYSTIDPLNPNIIPVKWISANEAQEPSSTAINSAGTKIFCTWEDGNNTQNSIAQRYFISGSTLGGTSTNNYSNAGMFLDGGHSGHVAAVGDYFVSTWVDGWISGGGVDDLGSGDIVYLSVVNNTETLIANKILVASGRQWWSDIAGSNTNACIIWQSFIEGQQYADLKMIIYNPTTGVQTAIQTIMNNVLYYHYSVEYIASIDRFLIIASKDGGIGANNGRLCAGGKAFLVDNNGTIIVSTDLSNGIVRESQSIVSGNRVVQTQIKNGQSLFGNNSSGGALGGIMVLDLTPASITLSQTIEDNYKWEYMGNTGFFKNCSTIVIFTLEKTGLQTKTFSINCLPTDIVKSTTPSNVLSFYPNPFSNFVVIHFNTTINNAELSLYNMYGQKIKTIKNISGEEIKIERNNLPNGLYFIRLTENNKIIAYDKLIICD